LLPLHADDAPAEIYLKLENLQPIGSFKTRPAGNAILSLSPEERAKGVYTASSGNMAQGVAYAARQLGIPATVLLTESSAATKVEALRRLSSHIRFLPDEEWWLVIDEHGHPDVTGSFIHPVANDNVLAGDATVGLEIAEELPDVDTVVVPYGGGGLSVGIAAALRALAPRACVLGAEPDFCAPLKAALEWGHPVEIPIRPSFITGIGVGRVLEEMWPLVKDLVAGAVASSEQEIADTIRFLFERHRIIAEGAGASSLAAALAGRAGSGKIVCVVSGGNLDTRFLTEILAGRVPGV
jgi:threonine dehydratase